jgi:hypothetical protein
MMSRTRLSVGLVICLAAAGVAAAENRYPLAIVGTARNVLVDVEPGQFRSVSLDAADVPARLRFRLGSVVSGRWTIGIESDDRTVATTISDSNISMFRLADDLIEVNWSTPGRLTIRSSTTAPKLRLLTIISLEGKGTTLNINGPYTLRYFERDVAGDARRLRIGRAIAQLQFETFKGIGACTAFQVAPTLFISSLHCVENEDRPADKQSTNRLVFGATLDNVFGEVSVAAEIIARGNLNGGQLLDYVLFRAPTPVAYRDAILPLRNKTANEIALGPVELYQQWTAKEQSPVGKVVSEGESCRIYAVGSPDGTDEICPYPMLFHQCASDSGSSGGAVVSANDTGAIAVHRSGGSGNCAVVSSVIIDRLPGPVKEEVLRAASRP